jgi:hypothetical protein
LVHDRTLILGKHYLKPTPKKLLFKWSEIEAWLGEAPHAEARILDDAAQGNQVASGDSATGKPKGKICI